MGVPAGRAGPLQRGGISTRHAHGPVCTLSFTTSLPLLHLHSRHVASRRAHDVCPRAGVGALNPGGQCIAILEPVLEGQERGSLRGASGGRALQAGRHRQHRQRRAQLLHPAGAAASGSSHCRSKPGLAKKGSVLAAGQRGGGYRGGCTAGARGLHPNPAHGKTLKAQRGLGGQPSAAHHVIPAARAWWAFAVQRGACSRTQFSATQGTQTLSPSVPAMPAARRAPTSPDLHLTDVT